MQHWHKVRVCISVVHLLADEIKNLRGTFGIYMNLEEKRKDNSHSHLLKNIWHSLTMWEQHLFSAYWFKTFWQSQLIIVPQHLKVIKMPERVTGNITHQVSINVSVKYSNTSHLIFWSRSRWNNSKLYRFVLDGCSPFPSPLSYLSKVEFSWERSLSITGWIPNMRNSYRRWIRNSRLVYIWQEFKEKSRRSWRKQCLKEMHVWLWWLCSGRGTVKTCLRFKIYLSTALTQHGINKRHDGCFKVDFISVSSCAPVQIVYKCLWDDMSLQALRHCWFKMALTVRSCILLHCTWLAPTHLKTGSLAGEALVVQHSLQDFLMPARHQAHSTHDL